MTFFESLLVLLLAAIVLLQVARRFSLPYPAMLAAGGMLVALVPGSPTIRIEPEMALALFIAPPLMDAAFDFPVGSARKFWRPLIMLAGLAVLATTAVVAWLGWRYAGMPVAAAIALGAIVAPPDAAAAVAVLRTVAVPTNTAAILKGESLFNDATALLLYGGAVAAVQHGGLTHGVEVRLLIAAPGGIVLGIALATIMRRLNRFVTGTLGGNLMQFVMTWLAWTIAARLGLSSVLCLVAFGMWLARSSPIGLSPRMRVHSYAVWATVVFLLNVIGFLVIGMQVRTIVEGMQTTSLAHALLFAGIVVVAVIGVRFVVVLAYISTTRSYERRHNRPVATLQQGVLVGWNGMRGLVTLATAFALPQSFPHRDLIVLTAFCVVITTTVLQGATLRPLIRLLRLDRSGDSARILEQARNHLLGKALESLDRESDVEAEVLKGYYRVRVEEAQTGAMARHRAIGLAVLTVQREELAKLLQEHRIDPDAFDVLQEELDWRALDLLPPNERRIEEG